MIVIGTTSKLPSADGDGGKRFWKIDEDPDDRDAALCDGLHVTPSYYLCSRCYPERSTRGSVHANEEESP